MTILDSDWNCRIELRGWGLYFAEISMGSSFKAEVLRREISSVQKSIKKRFTLESIATNKTIMALRQLFKDVGTSPSRYRPSSEALLRRVLKGGQIPKIHPLVDFNNLISITSLCPCCVLKIDSISPPVVLRKGKTDEKIKGLKGEFSLGGRPVLADHNGPFGTPITDDHRVILDENDRQALFLTYIPLGINVDISSLLMKYAGKVAIEIGQVSFHE